MRVGILTFHFCDNFGAVLQAAALWQLLVDLGHEAGVVDYITQQPKCYSVYRGWGLRGRDPLRGIYKRFMELRFGRLMAKRFELFRSQFMSRSEPCRTMDELSSVLSGYDAVVVGSDQVWNRSFGFVSLAYFLDRSLNYHGRRLSYAACCGHQYSDDPEMERIKENLLSFDFISVRNKVTYEWVNELTGLKPPVVCDPAVFADFPLCQGAVSLPFKGYILTYVLGDEIRGGHEAALAELKKVHGNLPVVAVATTTTFLKKYPYADHVVWDAGPLEWLSLIRNAHCLYTDSFHGVIFALKYRVQFLAYYAEEIRSHRLIDTGNRFGVAATITSGVGDAISRGCFSHRTDFEKATKCMESLAFESKHLLAEGLKDERHG